MNRLQLCVVQVFVCEIYVSKSRLIDSSPCNALKSHALEVDLEIEGEIPSTGHDPCLHMNMQHIQ